MAKTLASQAKNGGSIPLARSVLDGFETAYDQALSDLGRFNLARMLIALGRNDDAVVELERLIAMAPEDQESPRYLYALSTAHVRAGRVERALAYAQDARRLALAYDQAALVAAIDKDLAVLAAAQRQRQP